MKKLLVLLVLVCGYGGFAQNDVPMEDTNIYSLTGLQVKPEFPGGVAALNALVNERYVKAGFPSEVKGRLYATFVIEKDGTLSEIKILRNNDLEKTKALIGILKELPKWSPGQLGGKPVRVMYSVPLEIGR